MASHIGRWWLGIVIAVLYVPLVAMALMGFNRSPYGVLPFEFSLRWYEQLWQGGQIVDSVINSLVLALIVAITATLSGLGLSLWLSTRKIKAVGHAVATVLVASIAIPLLILSVGMFYVSNQLGFGSSFLSVWLGCTAVSLPFVVFVLSARLESIDPQLALASRTLGADRVNTFVRVVMPQVASALVAGAFIAFIVAFNNFPVQLFLSPIGFETFPVHIYTKTRVGVQPDINAMATIVLISTVLAVAALQALTGNASKFVSSDSEGAQNSE
jgi:ABC-type spermidine/putrescine transport system permease subunit II